MVGSAHPSRPVLVLETARINEVRTIEDHLDEKMSQTPVVGGAHPTSGSERLFCTISAPMKPGGATLTTAIRPLAFQYVRGGRNAQRGLSNSAWIC
jgi:hypothetical protein